MSEITAHLGKHVRCIYYQDNFENIWQDWPADVTEYAPDGSVAEAPVSAVIPGQRPLRLVVELQP